MARITRLIGGAGTGKTTALLGIIEEHIGEGLSPFDIGFCSFTRAARAEAAARVEARFGYPAAELQQDGWFRTLHSVCYQAVTGRAGKLLAGSKEDETWVSEAIGESAAGYAEDEDAARVTFRSSESPAVQALRIWSLSRSLLESLSDVLARLGTVEGNLPSLDYIVSIAQRYERAKRDDNRLDFIDLAGRFVGWEWNPEGYPGAGEPEGEQPSPVVWIFDEHQDVSPLLDSVAFRLVTGEYCERAYFAGDPFQSIYGFSGSDHRCFLDLEVDEVRTLDQSYRCPTEILALGETILSGCSDYFDRGIRPRQDDGDDGDLRRIARISSVGQLANLLVDPDSGSWLFLARTNRLAKTLMAELNTIGIPWDYTTMPGSGYIPAGKRRALEAILRLGREERIDSQLWKQVLKELPAGRGDSALIERGVKTRVAAGKYPLPKGGIAIGMLTEYGATDLLAEAIKAGDAWRLMPNVPKRFASTLRNFSVEDILEPRVRVGTIHSVKGSEADRVVLLTSLSWGLLERQRQSVEVRDSELRLAYVAATRARQQLLIFDDVRNRWRMDYV